jgi:hypothetical protein
MLINRILGKMKKNTTQFVTEIIIYETKENKLLKETPVNENELCKCLSEEVNKLYSFNKDNSLGYEMMALFITKFKKIVIEKYRLKIFNLIFSRNDMTVHLSSFLEFLFSNYSLEDDFADDENEEEEHDDNNEDEDENNENNGEENENCCFSISFQDSQNPFIKRLEQENDNELLDDLILFFFEMVFNRYFFNNK